MLNYHLSSSTETFVRANKSKSTTSLWVHTSLFCEMPIRNAETPVTTMHLHVSECGFTDHVQHFFFLDSFVSYPSVPAGESLWCCLCLKRASLWRLPFYTCCKFSMRWVKSATRNNTVSLKTLDNYSIYLGFWEGEWDHKLKSSDRLVDFTHLIGTNAQ